MIPHGVETLAPNLPCNLIPFFDPAPPTHRYVEDGAESAGEYATSLPQPKGHGGGAGGGEAGGAAERSEQRRDGCSPLYQPRSKVRMRDQVTVAVATENMHFFDPASHLAIWE